MCALQKVIDGMAVRVGLLRPRIWIWAGWSGPLGAPPQVRGRVNSPRPISLKSAFPCLWWWVGPAFPTVGVSSPMGTALALLLQCPATGRASYPVTSEGQG